MSTTVKKAEIISNEMGIVVYDSPEIERFGEAFIRANLAYYPYPDGGAKILKNRKGSLGDVSETELKNLVADIIKENPIPYIASTRKCGVKPSDKDRFWRLLDCYPVLNQFWDRENGGEVDLERLASAPLSGGEAIIADVLASIWLGNGKKHKIDFTDLATLNRSARQPLIDWINDPYWP